jgi:hypothetical protein
MIVAVAKQHARDTLMCFGLSLDGDVAAGGEGEGIDRQRRDALFLEKGLGASARNH